MSDRNDFTDPSDLNEPSWDDYEWPDPYEETDKQIGDGLTAKQTHAEVAAKEHAREALEELYHNEFPITDPPDSWERYEAEVTLRHLRQSIADTFAPAVERQQTIQINLADRPDAVEDIIGGDVEVEVKQPLTDADIEESKRRIDVMATYGQLAEPHIAALTYYKMPPRVRSYATEVLAEIRDEKQSSKSLSETIRDWLRGDG